MTPTYTVTLEHQATLEQRIAWLESRLAALEARVGPTRIEHPVPLTWDPVTNPFPGTYYIHCENKPGGWMAEKFRTVEIG